MTIKALKTAACAGALMSVVAWSGGAFAAGASGDSYSFEEGSGTLSETGLSGNGTYATVTPGEPTVGYPLTNANHLTVLEIAGTVTYTNDVSGGAPSSNASQVDFMFKVEPTDELENPDGTDIQVALAVGETNAAPVETAPVKLWCKAGSDDANANWVDLKNFGTGTWVRATLVLDYSTNPKRCKVSLNGDPAMNGTSEWFYFAGTAVQQYVKSISMVGSTQVDDLKVSHDALTNYEIPGGSTAVADAGGVTYDYINKYGVTVEQAQSSTPLNAESGMSVADKFTAGLDPKSSTKFALQTMTMDENNVTVKFPGTKGTGNYKVKVSTTKGGAVVKQVASTQTSPAGEGENSATVDLSELTEEQRNGLLYFTVETGSIE